MSGYTPAYLLKYLFLQLLTFFSAPRIEQDYGGFRSNTHIALRSSDFFCGRCGFNQTVSMRLQSKVVYPVNDDPSDEEMVGDLDVQSASHSQTDAPTLDQGHLHMLHDHVWLIIFEHLSDQDLVNLGKASPRMAGDVLRRYNVMLRRELVCFFTRKTFQEALLGVGVRLQEETLPHTPNLRRKALHIDAFDMLSHEAFEKEKVRQGICGHQFTHFFPLGLDDQHFVRAVPILQSFLESVKLNSDHQSPTGFLHVIPKLMNTMIVKMMTECDTRISCCTELGDEYMDNELTEAASRRAILQASENAFKGYCLLFHLLVKLSNTFPVIKAKAQEMLVLFLFQKQARNKRNIPDLGEFVAILPLVLDEGYDWAALSSALVEELLTRNVKWVLREKPELAELGIPARRRLQDTFKAS